MGVQQQILLGYHKSLHHHKHCSHGHQEGDQAGSWWS
jgi:hypothetical protein